MSFGFGPVCSLAHCKECPWLCQFPRHRLPPLLTSLESGDLLSNAYLNLQVFASAADLCYFSLFSSVRVFHMFSVCDFIDLHSIHLHWPTNQCKRISERFSDPRAGSRAVDQFCAAYKAATGVEVCKPTQNRPKLGRPTSWIVIPFDFVMKAAGIQNVLDRVRVPLGALGSFDRVKTSWSLSSKHLMHKLRTA